SRPPAGRRRKNRLEPESRRRIPSTSIPAARSAPAESVAEISPGRLPGPLAGSPAPIPPPRGPFPIEKRRAPMVELENGPRTSDHPRQTGTQTPPCRPLRAAGRQSARRQSSCAWSWGRSGCLVEQLRRLRAGLGLHNLQIQFVTAPLDRVMGRAQHPNRTVTRRRVAKDAFQVSCHVTPE